MHAVCFRMALLSFSFSPQRQESQYQAARGWKWCIYNRIYSSSSWARSQTWSWQGRGPWVSFCRLAVDNSWPTAMASAVLFRAGAEPRGQCASVANIEVLLSSGPNRRGCQSDRKENFCAVFLCCLHRIVEARNMIRCRNVLLTGKVHFLSKRVWTVALSGIVWSKSTLLVCFFLSSCCIRRRFPHCLLSFLLFPRAQKMRRKSVWVGEAPVTWIAGARHFFQLN